MRKRYAYVFKYKMHESTNKNFIRKEHEKVFFMIKIFLLLNMTINITKISSLAFC